MSTLTGGNALRRLLTSLVVGALAAFLFYGKPVFTAPGVPKTLRQLTLGITRRADRLFLDFLFRKRRQVAPPANIIVVLKDPESGRKLNLNERRSINDITAKSIENLKLAGAKGLVLDATYNKPASSPDDDKALLEAMSGFPVVIASLNITQYFLNEKGENDEREESYKPIEDFRKAAKAVGDASATRDSDGLVRLMSDTSRDGRLSLSAAGVKLIRNDFALPDERAFINYYGGSGSIKTIPFHRVVNEEPDKLRPYFNEALVFLGSGEKVRNKNSDVDSFDTPFSYMYGVEIQATRAANLIEGNWIRRWPRAGEAVFIGSVIAAILFLISSVKPPAGFAILCAWIFCWVTGNYYLFTHKYFVLPGTMPFLAGLPFGFIFWANYYYLVTAREKARLKATFSRFLSPDVVESFVQNPQLARPGGEKKEVTVFFSDLEGYSSIAEKVDDYTLGQIVNSYFSGLVNIIHEEGGTLISFIGDGLFALWGAPYEMPDGEARALRAAKKIQNLSPAEIAPGQLLRTRIGIHRGPALVGNFGGENRFDFTAIGDSVNIASRLESANKIFGTRIIVSEEVALKSGNPESLLPLGNLQVPGRKEVLNVFAVPNAPLSEEVHDSWHEAVSLFRGADWEEASTLFKKLTSNPGLAKAAILFLETIEQERMNGNATAGVLSFKKEDL